MCVSLSSNIIYPPPQKKKRKRVLKFNTGQSRAACDLVLLASSVAMDAILLN
jgi:hypothetical protein